MNPLFHLTIGREKFPNIKLEIYNLLCMMFLEVLKIGLMVQVMIKKMFLSNVQCMKIIKLRKEVFNMMISLIDVLFI